MKHALPIVFVFYSGVVNSASAVEQPNFVWLISEDNSKHYLRLFDTHGAETPAIERLASRGLIFENTFSNSPVCSVARTTLITGCYAPRIGTQYHRRSVVVPMPPGLRMFPAYLRDAGYYTTNHRKKDYNAVEGDGVWDESSPRASWRQRRKGQPFFHQRSFPVTHESSLHFSSEALQEEQTKTDPTTVFLAPHHPDTPTFRYTYALYHDRIRQMDAQVGAVVEELTQDGLLEDTFIFYFGDHGGVLPRSKGYAYESGLHVPLVVRVPEKWRHLVPWKASTRVSGFVSFVDFGPTLLHLAGIPVPVGVDGRPFLGAGVSAADVNERDEAFGYADRFDEKYDLVRTLRKGRYEYVRSFQPFNFDGLRNNYRYKMLAYTEWLELYKAGKLGLVERQFFEPRAPEALYDIEKDPYETQNLAVNPEYTKVLAVLRVRLAERIRGMPDLSLFPESALVEEAFAGPVAFGVKNKARIVRLADVADLSLVGFAEAEGELRSALESKDPWQRYWGLIGLSAHGRRAHSMAERAKHLADGDPELLVRTRAAEFLGLIGARDPQPVILDVLRKSRSGVEVNLILNTLVLLRDGKTAYDFRITPEDMGATGQYVKRRLTYLTGS
jgi:arylsulfatase A-like enzyme